MSSVKPYPLESPLRLDEVILPESDGQPMAETDTHRDEMVDLIEALKEWFRTEAQVYVSGNLLVYYDPHDLNRRVAPDVFVVRGVPPHRRRYYKVWEEGQAPDVVVEVSSYSTWDQDTVFKRGLYAQLGVAEYVLHDPTRDYLTPPLQGFRLQGEEYVPVVAAGGRIWSEVLQLEWRLEADLLRLYDPVTETYLLSPAEQAVARREAEDRLAILEAELSRLRERLTDIDNG